jgi:hypothetical protein
MERNELAILTEYRERECVSVCLKMSKTKYSLTGTRNGHVEETQTGDARMS